MMFMMTQRQSCLKTSIHWCWWLVGLPQMAKVILGSGMLVGARASAFADRISACRQAAKYHGLV
jgi:hypothetical protein